MNKSFSQAISTKPGVILMHLSSKKKVGERIYENKDTSQDIHLLFFNVEGDKPF